VGPATPATSGPASATAVPSGTAPAPDAPRAIDRHVEHVAWSPAGDRLAVWCGNACGEQGKIHVVDLTSGAARTVDITDAENKSFPRVVRFSPKGGLLIGSVQNRIALFKTADLTRVHAIEQLAVYEMFAVSPDETRFAWMDAFGRAEVVDLASKKTLSETSLHDPNAGLQGLVEWLPSSDRIVFGCDECTPELWGMKGQRIGRLNVNGTTWAQAAVEVTPDGLIAAASADGTVAMFDGTTGKATGVLRPKAVVAKDENPFTGVATALSEDGKTLVVGRGFGDVTVFALDTKKAVIVSPPGGAGAMLTAMALSPDKTRIAFVRDSAVWIVQATAGAAPLKLGDGRLVGFAADGTVVVHTNDAVVAWAGGKEKWRISAPETAGVTLAPGRQAVSVPDGNLRLIRVADQKTATLALASKDGKLVLAPHGGTTAADVTAVLGR